MDHQDCCSDFKCPFCAPLRSAPAVADYETVFAINDAAPITPGHLLVIPKRHTDNYFSMTSKERNDAGELLKILSDLIIKSDPTVLGFNIGTNSGVVAGQSVMHAHIHLIPRRAGDKPHWTASRDARQFP